MELKTRGIVLKRVSRDEKGLISSVFTCSNGKVRVVSRGTEKFKSRLRPSLEVFSLSDFHLVKSDENNPFYRLVGANCITQFEGLRESLKKIAAACVLAELTEIFMQPEDASEEVFELVAESLERLNSCAVDEIKPLENSFKIKFLKIAGYDMASDGAFGADGFISRGEESAIASASAEESRGVYGDVTPERLAEIIDAYLTGILGDTMNTIKFRAGIK